MAKFKTLPLSLAVLMVSQGALATITKIDDQTYKLETCNFPVNAKYDFTVSNGLSGGNRIGQDTCLKYTFRNGSVSPGDHINITVNGVTSSETVPGHKNSQNSGSQNSNYSPATTNTQSNNQGSPNSQPPQPSLPVLPTIDPTKAHDAGKEQAKMMADRVVKTYGSAERSLYSFYTGLQQGVMIYNSGFSSLSSNNDYNASMQSAMSSGSSDGTDAGHRQGNSDGNGAGGATAAKNFKNAATQGNTPDTQVSVPNVDQSNWGPNISQPKSIQQLLSEKNAQFIQILNGVSYDDDEYGMQNPFSASIIDLGTLYAMGNNYQFNGFLNSYGGSDWAFGAWQNRTLGGQYQNALDYFDKISDPNRVSNASQAQQEFTDGFKTEYRRIIDERYANYVRKLRPTVVTQGIIMGTQAAREYVEGRGQFDGYTAGFTRATGKAYNESYGGGFTAGFNSTVKYYQNNIVISDLDATLVPAAGQVFLPGLTLNLVINKVVNAGEHRGDVPVSISGSGVKPAPAKTITLEALKTLSDTTVPAIGGVAANVPVNTPVTTDIIVNDKQVSVSITVKFSDVVTALSNVSANAQATAFFNYYVSNLLTAEWKQAPGFSGKFYASQKSLLGELATTYAKLNVNQRKAILALKPDFVKLFGDKPSWIHRPTLTEWTAAQALLAQMN